MIFSGGRKWVYPRKVTGRFQRAHRIAGAVQHLLLFAIPLIPIAGHPALHVDLPERRVYALGMVFAATDTVLLMLLGLMAAFALFFFTSLFGRLWCGYLCPQTVFLEEWIRPIEKWFEGDRGARIRRDKQGFSWKTTWMKAGKFTAFAAVALVLSTGFMAYFSGPEIWIGGGGPVENALVLIFAAFWFADFAWFREQLCNYVCPYARFQGALTDDESLVIAFDEQRGVDRGKHQVKLGGCIDCQKCVAVCPNGIDIRDGFQLECISCARCIDACEGVMGKLGHEPLVRYTTVAAEEGRAQRLIRPRTVIYGGLITALAATFLGVILLHTPFEALLARAPGTLYTVDTDGMVRNTFILTVKSNETDVEPVTYSIRLEGLDQAELTVDTVTLGALESRTLPLIIRLPDSPDLDRTLRFDVVVEGGDKRRVIPATFKTGGNQVAVLDD